jgi:hypothetical protein
MIDNGVVKFKCMWICKFFMCEGGPWNCACKKEDM